MNLLRIFLILALFTMTASAAPKGVADYFLGIPSQDFTEGSPAELLAIIKRGEGRSLLDTKRGYMRLSGDGAQVSLQIALFRYADKSPLLAISYGILEEPDFTHVSFFTEKNGKMILADRTILPVPDSDENRFELPHHGRTIIIRDARGKILSQWTWDGRAFMKE